MQKHKHPLLTPEIERKAGAIPASSDRFAAKPPTNQPVQMGRTQTMGNHRHVGRTGSTAEEERKRDQTPDSEEC